MRREGRIRVRICLGQGVNSKDIAATSYSTLWYGNSRNGRKTRGIREKLNYFLRCDPRGLCRCRGHFINDPRGAGDGSFNIGLRTPERERRLATLAARLVGFLTRRGTGGGEGERLSGGAEGIAKGILREGTSETSVLTILGLERGMTEIVLIIPLVETTARGTAQSTF